MVAPGNPNPIGSSAANCVETVVEDETVLVIDNRNDPKWAMSSVELATSIDK